MILEAFVVDGSYSRLFIETTYEDLQVYSNNGAEMKSGLASSFGLDKCDFSSQSKLPLSTLFSGDVCSCMIVFIFLTLR